MADKTVERSRRSTRMLYCSFCGKAEWEVRKLVAGPCVFICNECHELIADMMKEPPNDPLATKSLQQFRPANGKDGK